MYVSSGKLDGREALAILNLVYHPNVGYCRKKMSTRHICRSQDDPTMLLAWRRCTVNSTARKKQQSCPYTILVPAYFLEPRFHISNGHNDYLQVYNIRLLS